MADEPEPDEACRFFRGRGGDVGLAFRGPLSGVLAGPSITDCSSWGCRSLKRVPQVVLQIGSRRRDSAEGL